MFRSSLLEHCNLEDYIKWEFKSIDYVMYVILAHYTKFGFLDDVTAVWRRGHSSVSNAHSLSSQIAYIENDIRMWHYLSSIFPQEFLFDEQSAENYRQYKIFQLGYKYHNYKIVRQVIEKNSLDSYQKKMFRIKKMCAKNFILFELYCILSKLKKT